MPDPRDDPPIFRQLADEMLIDIPERPAETPSYGGDHDVPSPAPTRFTHDDGSAYERLDADIFGGP